MEICWMMMVNTFTGWCKFSLIFDLQNYTMQQLTVHLSLHMLIVHTALFAVVVVNVESV